MLQLANGRFGHATQMNGWLLVSDSHPYSAAQYLEQSMHAQLS